MTSGRERLDRLMVARGLAGSRERARALILAGSVLVDGLPAGKAGTLVAENAAIEVRTPDHPYVSRGGLKLEGALDAFGIEVTGLVALDAGASTGGFTDCLLRRGAARVYAVDVGYGQFAWKLRQDSRVVLLERTNIRYVTGREIGEPLDLAVIDVSFISLKLVLPPVLALLRRGGMVLPLIKPQFEAGKDQVGKKGVVRDPEVHREVVDGIVSFARDLGIAVEGTCESPITGPEGNREFFLFGRKETEGISPRGPGDRTP
jgi:23S rRNA (cytidine1920-2'-O)/16S rRNA (cytidine1409-2'-O)-methyltransferase